MYERHESILNSYIVTVHRYLDVTIQEPTYKAQLSPPLLLVLMLLLSCCHSLSNSATNLSTMAGLLVTTTFSLLPITAELVQLKDPLIRRVESTAHNIRLLFHEKKQCAMSNRKILFKTPPLNPRTK